MTNATFSNGTTIQNNGTRAVAAAWAVIDKRTNETLMTGFSRDMNAAAKTAEGHMKNLGLTDLPYASIPARNARQMTKEQAQSVLKSLKAAGRAPSPATVKTVFDAAKALNEEHNADIAKNGKVEVVAL